MADGWATANGNRSRIAIDLLRRFGESFDGEPLMEKLKTDYGDG